MAASTSSTPDRLAFDDGDRTFSCTVARRCASDDSLWWWFSVSNGGTSRYAPFVAGEDDTAESVQARIIAHYDNMLARRAAPSIPRWRRATPSAAVEAGAELPAVAPASVVPALPA